MANRSFIAVMAALAVVGLLTFGLASTDAENIAVGEPAPSAPLPMLDGSGEASLADYEGQWVLVNFWASWCEPCRTESPAIEAYSEKMSDSGLVVVGVNTEDLSGDAQEFVDEFDLSWEMLRDGEGKFKDEYGIFALPESFLIDPDGQIALVRRGPVDLDLLEEDFTPLIEANPAPVEEGRAAGAQS